MIEIFETEALVNTHWHGREAKQETMEPLIRLAFQGGADVLGFQPNTDKGLTTARQVIMYRFLVGRLALEHIMHTIPFVMITEDTTEEEITRCVRSEVVNAKMYPRNRTTKSHNGVLRYAKPLPILKHCGKVGMKVHMHPEHPLSLFTNRDAEFAFLPIVEMYLQECPDTIFVWEHGTDARCIPHWECWARETRRFFVTLTAHHLATNEDETFGDVGATCKPPIKTEYDRRGLVDLVAKDYPWVMAGLDDAFHDIKKKHVYTGRCACGAYTAPFGLPLYAHGLDDLVQSYQGRLTFTNFTSHNARTFHKLPDASRMIKLERKPFKIPLTYPIGPETALPFWAGQEIKYSIADGK